MRIFVHSKHNIPTYENLEINLSDIGEKIGTGNEKMSFYVSVNACFVIFILFLCSALFCCCTYTLYLTLQANARYTFNDNEYTNTSKQQQFLYISRNMLKSNQY